MKETESVNQHLHQLDVKVVETIDSSGRITFGTEREMKERKAKKKTILFSPSFTTDVRERRIAIFVVYSSLVRSVIFHFSIIN